MLTCKDVTYLVSQSLDRSLSLPERLRLRSHLIMCNGCRNFRSQMSLLRQACQRLAQGEAPFDSVRD